TASNAINPPAETEDYATSHLSSPGVDLDEEQELVVEAPRSIPDDEASNRALEISTVPVRPDAEAAVDTEAAQSVKPAGRRARIEEVFPGTRDMTRGVRDKAVDAKTKDDALQQEVPGKSESRPPASRRPAEATVSGPAEELFTNKQGVDRSPSAWAERLRQAFSPAANSDARQEQPVKPTPPRSDTNVALKNQPAPKSPGTTSTPRVQTGAPKPADAPVKLPESTRRFLKPLVGIDPETVPVYEGPLADQITSSNRADGVALDGKIALARTTG